jgi:ATP-binding cassette, subfamily F, member 3
MSLITAYKLTKSFGPVDIFTDASFSIPPRARLAIVGPNGIGKSTLLRILTGEEEPSSGQVVRARGLRLGYLPQEANFVASGLTLWQECLSGFAELRQMEVELLHLEQLMADPAQAETALARYGPLQADFERQGGYTYPTRIRQVLTGLGFSPDEFDYPLGHLSGGQRTRALLARLLLSSPDLLVLDEPTNHLDIQAVEWLEGYLSQWEGAALIVSHDRYFLDRVANVILEMSRLGMETYRGNYSAYLQQRVARWERRQEVFEDEKERLLKEVDFIKRNISGTAVTQAKGRLRRLSRILQAIEQVGLETVLGKSWSEVAPDVQVAVSPLSPEEAERRVRSLSLPSHRPLELHLKLKPDQRSGNIVLRANDLVVGYPGKPLFGVQELELRRLECAALIGPNGAGKTTFLKTILEQLPPLQGEVTLGASLQVGYFAQAHEGLVPERTLVQEIDSVAPHMLVAEIRQYLAKYLFSGEDVFKKVEMLSGGERGRLALAKLALSNANLLLLDEPSNHLDIPAQEVLQEVLANFTGTILLVSHDRYLIDALATQIWEIDDRAGASLTIFKGTYSQYRQYEETQRLAAETAAEAERQVVSAQSGLARPKAAVKPSKISRNEERRRQVRLQQVEDQIGALEAQLKELSRGLENPPADPAKVQKLGREYVHLQKTLDELFLVWESLHEPAGET